MDPDPVVELPEKSDPDPEIIFLDSTHCPDPEARIK